MGCPVVMTGDLEWNVPEWDRGGTEPESSGSGETPRRTFQPWAVTKEIVVSPRTRIRMDHSARPDATGPVNELSEPLRVES